LSEAVPEDGDGRLTVDISGLLDQNRLTGVQRVLLTILEDSGSDDVRLIRFSPSLNRWELVNRLPYFSFITTGSSKLRQQIRSLAVRVIRLLRSGSSEVRLAKFLTDRLLIAGRAVYSAFFSSTKVSWERGKPLQPAELPSDVWILDIPKSDVHLDFLSRKLDSVRLHFYVYDLIPMTPKNTSGKGGWKLTACAMRSIFGSVRTQPLQ